ncbi:MAG: acyl-CoA dehydrogenase, partial [Deltaproteobacteria bacterium]|nr:acyl-CoA dehydrogenase [Deltaproteobacteria bacterium]
MNFGLSEEQKILRESIRKFAEKEITPVINEIDEKEEFSIDILKKMSEMGLLGIFVSNAYGGADMNYLSYIIAIEELARVDASQAATIAAGNSLGIGPIFYFGTEKQKEAYLPKLCNGEILASFGLTEPNAGSDAGGSQTTAKLIDGKWVINGSKIFITNSSSPVSGVCIVQAITG